MYGLSRGFGDTVVTDPVTGQQTVVMSAPVTTATVYASGAPSVYTDASGVPLPASSGTLTQWLNANSTAVIIGAVGFIAAYAFAKAGR